MMYNGGIQNLGVSPKQVFNDVLVGASIQLQIAWPSMDGSE
jgi:hypothetical protein